MTLRFTLRSLARSPGFVAIAVVTLGVGLGLSTTMFGVIDAVLKPYTAYRDPERLFTVHSWFGRRAPMTPAEVSRFLADQTRSFEAVVPVTGDALTLDSRGQVVATGSEGPAPEVWVRRVPPRYFAMMGARPERGRAFVAADGEDVVVLSRWLARYLLGARRSLEGASVTLGGHTYAVVGVMPRGADDASAWLPLTPAAEQAAAADGRLQPWVRLREGVTREQALAELRAPAQVLTDRFGARDAPFAFDLYPTFGRREELRDIHKAMVGAALVVLLIACVNLGHLMLARGLARRRELALRLALGASRGAVVRQMFAECLLITALGGALGALLAVWGAGFLRYRMPTAVAWVGLLRPQLSWRVFAAGALAAAAAAVLFGLMPAIRVALDVNVTEPLKEGAGTTTGRARHRYDLLVIVEVALALVLMMGGGLLLRTVLALQREAFNFDARRLYTAYLGVRPGADSTAVARRAEVLAAARSIPGVRDVAIETSLPTRGGALTAELSEDSTRAITAMAYPVVSAEYLRVLGLPILRGRDFAPGDEAGRGVAIVDPVAAQRLYPNRDPVGRMIKLGAPAAQAPWVPIVGVVRTPVALESAPRAALQPTVFVVQSVREGILGRLLVRIAARDPRTATQLQSKLSHLPGVRFAMVRPFDYQHEAEIASRGFLAKVFVAMGAVALGLAALGLYGVLAYAVGRRMREFAVRVALGADPRSLRRLVLHDGLVMLLAGTGVGAFVALIASRMLDAVLITVLPSDALSLVSCEAILLAVGLAAALTPALRASRANPMEILRAV